MRPPLPAHRRQRPRLPLADHTNQQQPLRRARRSRSLPLGRPGRPSGCSTRSRSSSPACDRSRAGARARHGPVHRHRGLDGQRAADIGDRRWRALLDAPHATVRGATSSERGAAKSRRRATASWRRSTGRPARSVRRATSAAHVHAPRNPAAHGSPHRRDRADRRGHRRHRRAHRGANHARSRGPARCSLPHRTRPVDPFGIAFEQLQPHRLKGVADEWDIYSVTSTESSQARVESMKPTLPT